MTNNIHDELVAAGSCEYPIEKIRLYSTDNAYILKYLSVQQRRTIRTD